MATATKSKAKRSEAIREELAHVQIFARTGRLPIISDTEEYIAPGVPPRKIPGVILEFGDVGVCELHPVKDANTIKVFREWMEDGSDPRILQLGVMEVAKDALLPPFPNWDISKVDVCITAVEAMGFDPERCLRYELGKGDDARIQLVKALEAKVDEPPAEDPLSEPVL